MIQRKQIKCENGIIKDLTLEETIEQFKFIKNTKPIFKWQWYFDQDDLDQLFYLGLIKTYNYYDINKGTSFLTMAYKIISREISLQFKKENKKLDTYEYISLYSKPKENKDDGTQLLDIIKDEEVDIDDYVANKDLYSRINNIINKLSDEYKQYIDLYFNKQYTYRDIANILNVSRQTVGNKIKVIKNKLKKEFVKQNIGLCY